MSKEFIESTMKRYGKDNSYKCISIPYKNMKIGNQTIKKTRWVFVLYWEKNNEDVIYEAPLNYIGSKAKIISNIRENLFPSKTFVDVFGGGFNVGINSNYNSLVYNDINFIVKDLISSFKTYDTYEYIMYVKRFIKKHNLEKGNKESYTEARDYYNNLPKEKKISECCLVLSFIAFNNKLDSIVNLNITIRLVYVGSTIAYCQN